MAQAHFIGKPVGPIGYGMMGLTWRPNPVSFEDAFKAMKAAVEAGATAWNAAEFYGPPDRNSVHLLKAYFEKYPEDAEKVFIVVKGLTAPDKPEPDSSPENIRRSIDNIIHLLGGTHKLDIISIARRDKKASLKTTLETIQKEYIDTGKVGGIFLSEVNADTVEEATKYAKIDGLEMELSMFSPDILQNGVAAAAAKHNIPIMAYSPIGRGMLTGELKKPEDMGKQGMIASFPRFQKEAFEHNLKLVSQVETLAKKKGCTPAQLAINFVRSLSGHNGNPQIVPIPGATKPSRVEENCKIVNLSAEEVKELEDMATSFDVAGGRYPDGAPIEL